MSRIVQAADGSSVEVEDIPFKPLVEEWSEYLLDDGTIIKVRYVMVDVCQMIDKFDATGKPVYIYNGTTVMSVAKVGSSPVPKD